MYFEHNILGNTKNYIQCFNINGVNNPKPYLIVIVFNKAT